MSESTREWLKAHAWACIGGLIGVVAGLRHVLGRGSLWEDEVIAITHGLQPLPLFFVEVLRNDIHPFFYFLLLKGWALVSPASDTWLLLSSWVLGLLTLWVLYHAVKPYFGRPAAWMSALLLAVLPFFTWASGNLRMYTLLPGLAVLIWYGNRKYLEEGALKWWVLTLLIQLAHSYTHAISFYFAFFIVLAVLIRAVMSGNTRHLKGWLCMQVAYLVLALPLVASALMRGTEDLGTPGLGSLLQYPVEIFSLWQPGTHAQPFPGAWVLLALFLCVALLCRPMRVEVVTIFMGAVLFAVLVSLGLSKTMFKQPVFAAHLLPFVVIPAAVVVAGWSRPWARHCAGMVMVILAVGSYEWATRAPQLGQYDKAAAHLTTRAVPGDIVVAPDLSSYWGLVRYAVGPEWGRPLEVLPLVANPMWSRVQEKLGPNWTERLMLRPLTDHVSRDGVKYIMGEDVRAHSLTQSRRVWIFQKSSYNKMVRLEAPVRILDVQKWGDVQLVEAAPDPEGLRDISPTPSP